MTDPYDGPWFPADCGRCGNSGVIPATRHSPPEQGGDAETLEESPGGGLAWEVTG